MFLKDLSNNPKLWCREKKPNTNCFEGKPRTDGQMDLRKLWESSERELRNPEKEGPFYVNRNCVLLRAVRDNDDRQFKTNLYVFQKSRVSNTIYNSKTTEPIWL